MPLSFFLLRPGAQLDASWSSPRALQWKLRMACEAPALTHPRAELVWTWEPKAMAACLRVSVLTSGGEMHLRPQEVTIKWRSASLRQTQGEAGKWFPWWISKDPIKTATPCGYRKPTNPPGANLLRLLLYFFPFSFILLLDGQRNSAWISS